MVEPVRLGLVGLNFGRTVCRELAGHSDLPVKLTKVCDLDTARAREVSEELGVPSVGSLDDLLGDSEIDAVGLYTGPEGRADLIRRAVRAGKHVMTTKPFELDANAALDVLREAAELGRVVHLNSPNARPFGEMAVIQKWLDEDAIGRPTMAQSNTWCYYGATPPDGTWYDDPRRCPVAPVFRIGIYSLNNFLSVFGEPATAQVSHSRIETGRPTPDNASLTVLFKNGGIANVLASFVVGSGPDRYRRTTTIAGTKGIIYFRPGPAPRAGQSAPNVILSTDDRLEERTVTKFSGDYDWGFFAHRVRGLIDRDVTTPEEIARAIRVVKAMSEAERTGQTVAVE